MWNEDFDALVQLSNSNCYDRILIVLKLIEQNNSTWIKTEWLILTACQLIKGFLYLGVRESRSYLHFCEVVS